MWNDNSTISFAYVIIIIRSFWLRAFECNIVVMLHNVDKLAIISLNKYLLNNDDNITRE